MTDTTDTADAPTITTDLVDVYLDMWRATDPEARAQLVARTSVSYTHLTLPTILRV